MSPPSLWHVGDLVRQVSSAFVPCHSQSHSIIHGRNERPIDELLQCRPVLYCGTFSDIFSSSHWKNVGHAASLLQRPRNASVQPGPSLYGRNEDPKQAAAVAVIRCDS
jgi:hypothetical protein